MDHAKEAEARLQEQMASLTDYIEREAAHRKILLEAAAASQERQRRMERAVAALSGATKGRKTADKPKRTPKSYVKAEMLERVAVVFGEHGPMTIKKAEALTGITDDSIRKAVQVLRDDGRMRLAGVDEGSKAPVPAKVWALMPATAEVADAPA